MDPSTNRSIEAQWLTYLKRCDVDPAKLRPDQHREMKRAFFGAWGQAFILMRDGIGMVENEEEAVNQLQDQLNQVGDFWHREVNKLN